VRALSVASGVPGHYIQLEGRDQALLIPVREDVLRIGRGLSAGLHLDDISVSRSHAIIVASASGAKILDDRSLNGTFVNGRRIEQVELSHGDMITIGRLQLRYVHI
jgi:pSer/pThr/pTyr-binding forkhead associated (FHA) protein